MRRPLSLVTTALLTAAVLAVGLLPAAAGAQPPGHYVRDRTPAGAPPAGPHADGPDARVVVAPIDSGINPYHEAFQVGEDTAVTPAVLAELGIDDAHVLDITTYEADVAAGLYDGLVEGEDYWFRGTNIIARSAAFGDRPLLPDSESDTHGTGVAGSVAAANPEAVIWFHEGIGEASETHAFTHPAVDIVTTSYGFLTALPVGGIAGSFQGVVEGGKVHVGANPNDPSPAPLDSTGGPWWGISISGFEEGSAGGKQLLSGSAPEFVADFTQDLPYCATCQTGTESVSGTSFATPTSAGVLSAALLELRRRAGHVGGITTVDGTPYLVHGDGVALTNWDLRRALEEAAAVPSVEEYDPTGILETALPNPPIAGHALYGWGLITSDPARSTVDGILDFVATGQPRKDAETCASMALHFQARVLAWAANPSSDGFGVTSTGHLPC